MDRLDNKKNWLLVGDHFIEYIGGVGEESISNYIYSLIKKTSQNKVEEDTTLAELVQIYLDSVSGTKLQLIRKLEENFSEDRVHIDKAYKVSDSQSVKGVITDAICPFETEVFHLTSYLNLSKMPEGKPILIQLFGSLMNEKKMLVGLQERRRLLLMEQTKSEIEELRRKIAGSNLLLLGWDFKKKRDRKRIEEILKKIKNQDVNIYCIDDKTLLNLDILKWFQKNDIELINGSWQKYFGKSLQKQVKNNKQLSIKNILLDEKNSTSNLNKSESEKKEAPSNAETTVTDILKEEIEVKKNKQKTEEQKEYEGEKPKEALPKETLPKKNTEESISNKSIGQKEASQREGSLKAKLTDREVEGKASNLNAKFVVKEWLGEKNVAKMTDVNLGELNEAVLTLTEKEYREVKKLSESFSYNLYLTIPADGNEIVNKDILVKVGDKKYNNFVLKRFLSEEKTIVFLTSENFKLIFSIDDKGLEGNSSYKLLHYNLKDNIEPKEFYNNIKLLYKILTGEKIKIRGSNINLHYKINDKKESYKLYKVQEIFYMFGELYKEKKLPQYTLKEILNRCYMIRELYNLEKNNNGIELINLKDSFIKKLDLEKGFILHGEESCKELGVLFYKSYRLLSPKANIMKYNKSKWYKCQLEYRKNKENS